MPASGRRACLSVDPQKRFELSPWLFMQFMEPLGATDSSVEAAWDFQRDRWREDVVAVTRTLAPALLRWGGCFSSYYRWREGVGPRNRRVPMHNLLWGGMETNQVGTHEFVDFARSVGAEPFFCVNFESDGRKGWARPRRGGRRSAGPAEAAAWVDYCNNPGNSERRRNGAAKPFALTLWQIGNETSYDRNGFDCNAAVRRTAVFARAMRGADPDIDIIAWGDSGWAPRMIDGAGEHFRYVAFHHHFNSGLKDSPLRDTEYRKSPERTWKHLMNAWKSTDERIREMRREVEGSGKQLALTESHFALPGRNRCEVLSTWAAGCANARILNTHARHGDILKIATLADFCGNRWQVNAVMIHTPGKVSYLQPVGSVTALFRRHGGRFSLDVKSAPAALDATASRTGRNVFLHVVNTDMKKRVRARLAVEGVPIRSGRIFEIAADPMAEVMVTNPCVFDPVEKVLPASREWIFPPASVSAVQLVLE
ncbi:MAG: alpha-L-arabinofuranosidase [Planctomycetes bacterium]|nr:alpha-L-arabinofuranosidase [Planctomycetota bacterium]